jgi:hypothetical protein
MDTLAKSTAIIAVHGVTPQQQYGFQDQVAAELKRRLNNDPKAAPPDWTVDIIEPAQPAVAADKPPNPTLSRVYRSGETLTGPSTDYYDVIEAYWSPLDKVPIAFTTVLTWLFNTLIAPVNTTAYLHSEGKKTWFDITFVVLALTFVCVCLAATVWALYTALVAIAASSTTTPVKVSLTDVLDAIGSPAALAKLVTWNTAAILLLGAAGIYLVSQAAVTTGAVVRQWAALGERKNQRVIRIAIAALAACIGLAALTASGYVQTSAGKSLGWNAIFFLIAAALITLARTVGETDVVNFFRDVQIYTTRDQNLTFYELREKILELVTERIRQVTSATADGGVPYDRVIVLAHSLGSTIAMDALMRLQALREQKAYKAEDMNRIRAFVTFGTALEKTKFFFDKTNPTPSQSISQWRNDVYGTMFTPNDNELDHANDDHVGIYWANYWYDVDPVCDPIESYRSFLLPGETRADAPKVRRALPVPPAGEALLGRVVCCNDAGSRPLYRAGIAHTDYLADAWFWTSAQIGGAATHLGVLDIVRRRAGVSTTVAAKKFLTSPELIAAGHAPPHPQRYEQISTKAADSFTDKVV